MPVCVFSQKPAGLPFIRNYSPTEYHSSPENWAIAQDKRGVMYFANGSCVLEYDGVKWRLIPVSNNSLVRSIAIDSSGIVYVGAVGEFGFLEPDEKGCMIYRSMVERLPAADRDFADVWKTYVSRDGVYFQTFSKLIRINKASVKVWKPETSFHFSYCVNGKYYINERERGLKYLDKDALKLVSDGDLFAGLRIYAMLSIENDQVLIATREKGLIMMNEKTQPGDSTFKLIPSDVNFHLINAQIYGGVRLSGNRFAFATLQKGVFIVDEKFQILQVLNKEMGLRDDIIKSVAVDKEENLWLALGNGISHVEVSSPLSTLNDAQGLKGFVQDITSFKGQLFVATTTGVYVSEGERFVPVKGVNSQTWSLKKVAYRGDTMLLAAAETGIFNVGSQGSEILQEGFGYFIYQSKKDTKRIFIGMNDGVLSMRHENGKWISEDYLNGIEEEIRSIAEDRKGDLWLGTPFDGLIRITFHEGKDSLATKWNVPFKIGRFDTLNGLPGMKYNIPYNFRNSVVFATTKGLLEFEESTNRFVASEFLRNELKERQIFRIGSKDSSAVWLVTVTPAGKKETGIGILRSGNVYTWYTQPFQKVFEREIHAVFPDDANSTWLGGPDGVLHYDANIKKDFSKPFHALIRMVILNSRDSIFGGSYYETTGAGRVATLSQAAILKPEIKYSNNSVQFEFSAVSYGDEKNNLYNVYLEGKDTAWSKWSEKVSKEYTNLYEGDYTFRVKAKNIYGTESMEASYQFKILPPWYRTVWAYIIYAVSFIGFVYLIIRLSVRRLVKAKNKLEGIVKERTAEVVSQKHLIEEKQKEIIDSINYAQRIQRALLASDNLLKENLPEHFVFFQPKDIVSGDFYWGSKMSNGRFALVTADSTGHGVPGAIMSMLNISCLNEAINGQNLTGPGEILNYARAKIIFHLANDGSAEGGKDGMDCSLLSMDLKSNQLIYAAANNPVWIVRNKQILEYDPDKMPVGKHDNDKVSFSQHTIDLQKGDMVYTLTDGMPDQFGGPKGKKFMYKQLKELLVSLSHLSMTQQKENIRTALNNWKGELEQVDDVCLIGIRV